VNTARRATTARKTAETRIEVELALDGRGSSEISTGFAFFDHMLAQLAKHSRWDLRLSCVGDGEVDDHHTIEDCALALGACIDMAVGERRGIRRFGTAHAPLDEALARAVVDLSGRPGGFPSLNLTREMIGGVACENLSHALRSLAIGMRATIHVEVLHGENNHHMAEAAFKALALALREAAATDIHDDIPSTKEVL
jgi:imidazoleglycerol phosphate dehydratase HisB